MRSANLLSPRIFSEREGERKGIKLYEYEGVR